MLINVESPGAWDWYPHPRIPATRPGELSLPLPIITVDGASYVCSTSERKGSRPVLERVPCLCAIHMELNSFWRRDTNDAFRMTRGGVADAARVGPAPSARWITDSVSAAGRAEGLLPT